MEVDKCGRLWVLDTGAINLAKGVEQLCPLKIDIFDLKTDRHVKRFIVPANQTSNDSLFTNIVVEIIDDNCEDAHAYISDVFQYGLIVYNYKEVTYRIEFNNNIAKNLIYKFNNVMRRLRIFVF